MPDGTFETKTPFMRTVNIVDPIFIERFDSLHGKGSGNRLVRMLQRDCITFTFIAKEFNMSKERIRQLYNQHVKHTMETPRTGHQRRTVCNMNKSHITEFPEHVLTAWRKARQKGLTVTHVNISHPYKFTLKGTPVERRFVKTLTHVININGRLCRINKCDTVFSPSGYGNYLRAGITKKIDNYDFFIAHVKSTDLFYVIPTYALRNVRRSNKTQGQIYLRADDNDGPRSHSPWDKYREAWHLLR